jgi:hypothetical protein
VHRYLYVPAAGVSKDTYEKLDMGYIKKLKKKSFELGSENKSLDL